MERILAELVPSPPCQPLCLRLLLVVPSPVVTTCAVAPLPLVIVHLCS